jgi:hypothetical protein
MNLSKSLPLSLRRAAGESVEFRQAAHVALSYRDSCELRTKLFEIFAPAGILTVDGWLLGSIRFRKHEGGPDGRSALQFALSGESQLAAQDRVLWVPISRSPFQSIANAYTSGLSPTDFTFDVRV